MLTSSYAEELVIHLRLLNHLSGELFLYAVCSKTNETEAVFTEREMNNE